MIDIPNLKLRLQIGLAWFLGEYFDDRLSNNI